MNNSKEVMELARPSNRGSEQVDNENVVYGRNYFHTAIYIRLSYESYYTDSESIENQKLLLTEYIKNRREFVLCGEYIDDGKTGTNFNRPAFEQMMRAVKEGTINCIIVNDLSRFGRNHVEVGDYIERIFPFLGVRFISINDEYDSFNPACDRDQLLMSVKNLMHEMYARDVSKKISSAIKIKQKTGEFYRTAIIPYGYKMGTSEYEIDEQAATVVRRIFQEFISGDSVYHICTVFNDEGIASPKEYARNKLLYLKERVESCWLATTVKRILINEVYIGNMIRHKTEQEFYNNNKTKEIAKKDWIRTKNTHPAIIDKEVFLQVQRKLTQNKFKESKSKASNKTDGFTCYKKYSYDENIFKKKIFCGECKAKMTRVNIEISSNKETFIYKGFSCGLHRNSISKCGHREIIEEDVLCSLVNRIVVEQANLYNGLQSLIKRCGEDIFNKERFLIKADRNVITSRITEYEESRFDILEEYHQGKIDKSQVIMRRSELQNLIEQCNEQDRLLEKRLLKVDRLEIAYGRLMNDWLDYIQNPKITKEIITLFVERIDVYSPKRVVIKFNHIDYV